LSFAEIFYPFLFLPAMRPGHRLLGFLMSFLAFGRSPPCQVFPSVPFPYGGLLYLWSLSCWKASLFSRTSSQKSGIFFPALSPWSVHLFLVEDFNLPLMAPPWERDSHHPSQASTTLSEKKVITPDEQQRCSPCAGPVPNLSTFFVR